MDTSEIKITANDDLLIEGNATANINHTFSSDDSRFDGLNETLSVNVIDNDFQRSNENNKMPSDGNNYIIYDLSGQNEDLYIVTAHLKGMYSIPPFEHAKRSGM